MDSIHRSATPADAPRDAPPPTSSSYAAPYRVAVSASIALTIAASWAWLVWQDWAMRHMSIVDMAMPSNGPWAVGDIALVFTMWAVMMVAMMLPTALPMLAAFRRTDGARGSERDVDFRVALFAIGYVAVWTGFSVAATAVQWALHALDQISSATQITNDWVGAAVLITAGAYQWSALKARCLRRCRSPLSFLLNRWRPGLLGSLRMGFEHGAYCTGCCWLLMAVLFVVGAMNVAWIVALTLYVLVEKLAPAQRWLARAAGAALIGWGIGVAGSLA
jgi:predicted metal-binding membrane protein